MRWILVLGLCLLSGCATRLKGSLQTESEWRVKNDKGHEYVFPPELKTPVTLEQGRKNLVIEIPHKEFEIKIPLRIPGQALETKGETKFPASQVGQIYDVTVWRQEERHVSEKLTGSEHCTYVTHETRCGPQTFTDPVSGQTRTENRCQTVPVERSGRKWIQYSPVREDTTILISFLEAGGEKRIASFQTQEQKGSRAIWNEGQCF